MKKKLLAMGLAITMCCGLFLTGCNGNNNAQNDKNPSDLCVLSVGEEEIYMNEVNFYALSFAKAMGITADTDLSASFSTDSTYDEAYKAQLLLQIRQSKILYLKAVENGITLSDEQIAEAEANAEAFLSNYDAATLEKYGFDKESMVEIYKQRAMILALEQQIASEVVLDTDEETEYGTIENMVFLKVEIDENGSALLDENGDYVFLSESEQAEQKANAEAALERVKNGESIDDLIEEYDIATVSGEVHATTASLESTYGLKDGEISDIIENDYSYTIVKVVQNYDEEYSKTVEAYYLNDQQKESVSSQEQKWFDEFEINDEDLNQEVWDEFSFEKYFE